MIDNFAWLTLDSMNIVRAGPQQVLETVYIKCISAIKCLKLFTNFEVVLSSVS